MSFFLHSFQPPAIAFALGPVSVHWYGLLMALAIGAALYLAIRLARRQDIPAETVLDVAFWIIIVGLIGARLYEVALEWPYYLANPAEILKVWRGGLAIHGALLGGFLGLWLYARRASFNIWKLVVLMLPGVALGQAIGRWGNWFNQELFGRPTDLPWGIPIALINRPAGYEFYGFFQPTFLYESIGCLVLAIVLAVLVYKRYSLHLVIAAYLLGYGAFRFFLEFIKIDPTPEAWGLRWPQIMSLGLVLIGVFILVVKNPRIDSSG